MPEDEGEHRNRTYEAHRYTPGDDFADEKVGRYLLILGLNSRLP
jgi:hypothetical protein